MSISAGSEPSLEGAIIGQVGPTAPIGVSGRDRASFLQGLLTNDIVALGPGQGCYAAWLTPQGRMLTDLYVFESGDAILAEVPLGEHAATLARLERFLFSEDVQIADLSSVLRSVWLHGAEAATVLETATGLSNVAGWSQGQNARAEVAGMAVSLARIDQLGVAGFCLHVEASQHQALLSTLERLGARSVPQEFIDAARVDAGYPLWGTDLTPETIPLEAGLEARAISRSKGCYVGQEVIIRVLDRGQGRVVRRLVSLRLEDSVPAPRAKAFVGDREVGWVTSAARSHRSGPVALAYLHRDTARVGAVVDIEIDAQRASATVRAVLGPETPPSSGD
jgi:tRNA-modifying protein YgfZ